MNLRFKHICIFYLTASICSSCIPAQKTEYVQKKISVSHPKSSSIVLTNNSNTTASFAFNLNDRFFSSTNNLINAIADVPGAGKDSLFYKAWQYLCSNTYSGSPISKAAWSYSILPYITSAGFGSCDLQSIVMSAMWEKLGYKTRIWKLNGHTVPEVFSNNRWLMLDPTYKVYYLNSKNEIAGVEELSSHPEYITNPSMVLRNDSMYRMRYSQTFSELYASIQDNKLMNTDTAQQADTFFIELPPLATLQFPGIFTSVPLAVNKTEIPYFAQAIMKIPPSWTGKIKNSLIIAEIRGKASLSLNERNNQFEIHDTVRFYTNNEFIHSVEVLSCTDTLEIIYFLNPFLTKLNNDNMLDIEGFHLQGLNVEVRQVLPETSINAHLEQQYFFYGIPRTNLLNAILQSDSSVWVMNDTIKSFDELKTAFEKYCRGKGIGNDSCNEALKKLDRAFSKIPVNHDLTHFFETISLLPLEYIFYDILQAPEKKIYLTILDKTKPE